MSPSVYPDFANVKSVQSEGDLKGVPFDVPSLDSPFRRLRRFEVRKVKSTDVRLDLVSGDKERGVWWKVGYDRKFSVIFSTT